MSKINFGSELWGDPKLHSKKFSVRKDAQQKKQANFGTFPKLP